MSSALSVTTARSTKLSLIKASSLTFLFRINGIKVVKPMLIASVWRRRRVNISLFCYCDDIKNTSALHLTRLLQLWLQQWKTSIFTSNRISCIHKSKCRVTGLADSTPCAWAIPSITADTPSTTSSAGAGSPPCG